MGSNKQQRRSGIILNFIKGETFSYVILTFLHPPKKSSSSPLQFGQEDNIPRHSFTFPISTVAREDEHYNG